MVRPVWMRCRAREIVLTCAIAAFSVAGAAIAQDKSQPDPAAMEAHMKAMTPGPHHAALAKRAGTWKSVNKMFMAPDAPPVESTGTSTFKTLLDGRFLEQTAEATMFGMPFKGHGVDGYDNTQQKHIGTWYDTGGTTIMFFEGTCDGACRVITTTADFMDPMTRTMKTMKMVSTMKSDDEMVLDMYDVAKDGTETKMGIVTFTRQSESQAARE